VASQFNTLEFIDETITPENGIGIYVYDSTQGPRCAIACAPVRYWWGFGIRARARVKVSSGSG